MPIEIGHLGDGREIRRSVNIRPTVLIGLGGTGKEVLRRMRRMFYEKYRVVGLPVMEYLWFDTDIRAVDLTGAAPDYLDRRIDFTAREKIDGRIRPNDLDGYRRQKGAFPYIWDWFPEALDSLPSDAVMQGAGQIRPCGRLAFFHHYTAIRNAIQQKAGWVTSTDARRRMEEEAFSEYSVEQDALEIIIVTSIGGGTGSGCFMDVGFLCRELYPNSIRTAFMVLPNVFDSVVGSSGQEAVHANGFASLKELEYFMQPRFAPEGEDGGAFTTHSFYWDGQEHSVPAPPFSTVYQVDNQNVTGGHIEDFTDTFQMIAEFLLLDFDRTNFATEKRSVRSNLEQYMQEVATFRNGNYVQYFPCRYASFGLSQIELNQPRLANAAASRFAQYLVEFMLAPDNTVPPGYSYADVNPHLEQMDLTTERLLARTLARPGEDFVFADRIIHEVIDPAFNALVEQIHNAPEAKSMDVLEQQVRVAQRQVSENAKHVRQLAGEALKEIGMQRGEDLKQILQNIGLVRPKLEQRVEEHCIGLLCDPLEYGPNFMVDFLRYALEAMERVRAEVDAVAAQPLSDPEAQEIGINLADDVRRYNAMLDESRDMRLAWQTKRIAITYYKEQIRKAFGQSARVITRDLVRQVEAVRAQLKEWVRNRYRKEAAGRMLEPLVDNLIGFLGSRVEVRGEDGQIQIKTSGLQARVRLFQDNLGEMSGTFHELHQAYLRRPSSVRNLDLMPDLNYPVEVETYLRDVKSRTGDSFRAIQQDVLRLYFGSEMATPLFAALASREGTDVDAIRACTREIFNRSANRNNNPNAWNEVESTLDMYTFDLFKDFKADVQATAEFERRLSASDRKKEIIKRAGLAEPRVSWPRQTIPGMAYHGRYSLGLPEPDHPLGNQVNELVTPKVGGNYQATAHAADSVVFAGQWMAFPMFAVGNLVDLHSDYEKNLSATPQNVFRRHMTKDYVTYPEILPPWTDAEVQALIDAQQPLIDGILMGIVRYDEQRGFYRSFRERGLERGDTYGPTLELARLGISRDRALRDRLRVEVQKLKDGWSARNNRTAYEQYMTLQSYLLNKVFPKTVVRVLNKDVSADSTFRILLEEAYRRDFDKVAALCGHDTAQMDQVIEEWTERMNAFAVPLPYRDAYCKDSIYVMEGE